MKRPFLLFVVLLSSCTSSSKRLAEVDLALAEVQAGHLEQGRGLLEKLCAEGGATACALTGKKVDRKEPLPILQSVTSANQSRFVVVVPRKTKLEYYISDISYSTHMPSLNSPRTIRHLQVERLSPKGSESSDFAVDQVEAFDLDPAVDYTLVMLGPDGDLWDRRDFRSLDLRKHRGRFAVVSGMDDHSLAQADKIWTELLRQRPSAILMIGDNVFSLKTASATPEILWNRYVETRQSLAIFKADPLLPTFAVWDAHDFGKNDGDRTYAYKDEALAIFFSFFAQKKPADGFERGPGVSSWWTAFGADFAFLDNRTFRSPDGLDLPDQTHFGAAQEQWLSARLNGAKGPVFLVSGDPFFGGYHPFESYEGNHPKRFQAHLNELKQMKSPLIFLSGDRHLSEIINVPAERLGYLTYEFTASAIHAPVNADAFNNYPSPQRLVGAAGTPNYMMIEVIRSVRNFIQLDVQSFSLDQTLLYQKTLTVKRQ